jgi:replication-associated recombination protein RarA
MASFWKPTKTSELIYPDDGGVAATSTTAFTKKLLHRLMLWGDPGNGKTDLLNVLVHTRAPNIQKALIFEINASADDGIGTLRTTVEAIQNSRWFGDDIVLIIEEIDRFSPVARGALKGLLDKLASVNPAPAIIATSNDPNKLEWAVRSRFRMVAWTQPNPNAVKRRLKQVLDSLNVELSDAELKMMIAASGGSVRELFEFVLPEKLMLLGKSNFGRKNK